MAVANGINWTTIGSSPVAILDEHHHALIPWSRWARTSYSMRLITIDHHCDTHEAFLRASWDGVRDVNRVKQQALRTTIVPGNEQTVEQAITLLRHDEHIDAAIRSGIIDAAFIINEQNVRYVKSLEETEWRAEAASLGPEREFIFLQTVPRPEPPMTYAMPVDRMVAVDPTYYRRGDDLIMPWPDLVLETEHLDNRMAIYDHMLGDAGEPALQSAPYVLDIDMDAFRTLNSLKPHDPSTFHRLIAGAVGITIARERACCSELWLDDTPINHTANEAQLLLHLHDALA